MNAKSVGIDLAKDVFELAFADDKGLVIERMRLSRKKFAHALEQRPPLHVVMEACGSAHYWGRRFTAQGHTVRLIAPGDVRPYVRRNKTDRTDVAGILEADRCADIYSVPLKTPEQQGVQALHRIREHLKNERIATINMVRGVLREFGIVIALGAKNVRSAVRDALEDGDNDLPMSLRHTVAEQLERLESLQDRMRDIERRLEEFAGRDAATQRYLCVPGIGLLTATALRASVGDLGRFRNGRRFSAWLGLVPREHSSGQHRRLGRITKRGDIYLRMLLLPGGRSVLVGAKYRRERSQPLNAIQQWALAVQERKGINKAVVALANKIARRLWAMEHHGKPFSPNHCSERPSHA